jgi:amino acid transporter
VRRSVGGSSATRLDDGPRPSRPAALPAADASTHRLRPDVVSLGEGVVVGLATSAPGQSTAVVLAALVATSAYASGPAILLGMLPMLAIALCYRRLNRWEQNAGGPYVWVGRAIGPVAGYAVAWAMLVGFSLGAVSDLLPLGPALLGLVGLDPNGVAGNVASATVLGLSMTLLAAIGLRTTVRFQLVLSVVEYAILLAFGGLAFVAVFVQHRSGTVHPAIGWVELAGSGGRGSLAGAMLLSVFLFAGWDAPVYLAEETKQRRSAPGSAAVLAVLLLGALYAGLFVALQGVVSARRLAAHATDALGYLGGALAGSGGARLMTLAVVLSVLGTTQATIVATSRVTYAMGTDRLLPRSFGTVSRWGTPARAAIFWGVVAVAIADGCAASPSLAGAFADVANAGATAFSCFYVATAVATVVYYRRLLRRSARDAVLAGVVPLAGAAALVWVIVDSYGGLGAATHWVLAVLAAAGLGAMGFSARVARSPYFRLRREAYR